MMTRTEVPERVKASNVKPEVEFRAGGRFLEFRFEGIYPVDQDIFTNFGVCVENGVPQRVEWSTCAILEYPRWRMAS